MSASSTSALNRTRELIDDALYCGAVSAKNLFARHVSSDWLTVRRFGGTAIGKSSAPKSTEVFRRLKAGSISAAVSGLPLLLLGAMMKTMAWGQGVCANRGALTAVKS
jgi:hypothetical protein